MLFMLRVSTIRAGVTYTGEPSDQDQEVTEAVVQLLRSSGIEAHRGPWHSMGMALSEDVMTILDTVSYAMNGAMVASGLVRRYIATRQREAGQQYSPTMHLQIEAPLDGTVDMRQLVYLLPAIHETIDELRPGVLVKTALICPAPPARQCEVHIDRVLVTDKVRDKMISRLKPDDVSRQAVLQTVHAGRVRAADIKTRYVPLSEN